MKPEHKKPDHTCDACGKFEAFPMSDRWLCEECYANSGACCAGDNEDAAETPSPGQNIAKQVCHPSSKAE